MRQYLEAANIPVYYDTETMIEELLENDGDKTREEEILADSSYSSSYYGFNHYNFF